VGTNLWLISELGEDKRVQTHRGLLRRSTDSLFEIGEKGKEVGKRREKKQTICMRGIVTIVVDRNSQKKKSTLKAKARSEARIAGRRTGRKLL